MAQKVSLYIPCYNAGKYIEKKVIAHALNITGGNKVKAAKILNISYKALFYKMNDLGLR